MTAVLFVTNLRSGGSYDGQGPGGSPDIEEHTEKSGFGKKAPELSLSA
jgi:hypothetical protein